MHYSTTPTDGGASLLASLRALLPERRLSLHEALIVAERQADRLRQLRTNDDVPVPISVVTDSPRIHVSYDNDLPEHAASGASTWDSRRRAWIISINPNEPCTRQRVTVLHEYKHIIDHFHPGLTGQLPDTYYGLPPVEYIADYFAGCVLMPKRTVKAAYYDGIQNPHDLAQLLDVSPRAIQVRLSQLGLTDRPSTARGASKVNPKPPLRGEKTLYRRAPVLQTEASTCRP